MSKIRPAKFKPTKYPPEILAQFKPVERKDGRWAVQLAPGRILHWIETTDDSPMTVGDPNFTMQSWDFKEQAQGICDWLKKRWSDVDGVDVDDSTFSVEVDLSKIKAKA
jgi:hypothetical protein